MNTSNYRVLHTFTKLNNSALETFTRNVLAKMTGNPAFANPPVPLPDLTAAVDQFATATAAALNGGRAEMATRNRERAALLGLLRQQAYYVQTVAGSDLATLVTSGFLAASTNRAQIVLPKPAIEKVENPQSTVIAVRLQPVPTARAYELRMSFGTSGWQVVGTFTQARRILLENLTPGTTYTVQARAIGGLTGSSDWSDPVSRMST